jgi:hypothetical protein
VVIATRKVRKKGQKDRKNIERVKCKTLRDYSLVAKSEVKKKIE